ncbi:hypothetical protein DOY81_005618 [Sarcophaga bullata]|nr:hypothetical protein DOY81_005618 [Sarcophaga bullata]
MHVTKQRVATLTHVHKCHLQKKSTYTCNTYTSIDCSVKYTNTRFECEFAVQKVIDDKTTVQTWEERISTKRP